MKIPEAKKRIMPDNPSNLFDLLEDSDETYPPEADVLPTDIDDFLRAGYARYLKQKGK